MAKSEALIQNEIMAAIGSLPGVICMRNAVGQAIHTDARGNTRRVTYGLGEGSPDLVCIIAPLGKWVGLEVKVPGEKPRPEQVRCHAAWRAVGAVVAVVTSVPEALAALEEART